eukprot:4727803-Pyramimonas_sp.AAC.1
MWCKLCGAIHVVQSARCNVVWGKLFGASYVSKLRSATYVVQASWCGRCGARNMMQTVWVKQG